MQVSVKRDEYVEVSEMDQCEQQSIERGVKKWEQMNIETAIETNNTDRQKIKKKHQDISEDVIKKEDKV